MVALRLLIMIFIISIIIPLYANDNITIKPRLSKDTVWQREQTILSIEIITEDALSRLESKPYKQSGLTIIPYPLEIIEASQTGKTKLILKWAIFPFADKSHVLTLPRIRYRPSRGRPVTLDIPKLTLTVNKLPIYVPPTMPVGKISLSTQWQSGMIITSHRLSEWQITVSAEHIAPAVLPVIMSQLKSTDTIEFLPIKKQLSQIKNDEGIEHKQHYQAPVKALSFGRLELPEITIQYFDPESSTLKMARQKTPFVIALYPWMLWILFLLLALAAIVFIATIAPHIKLYLQKRLQKKLALTALQEANTYPQIRAALMQYASAKGWGDNMTLQGFSYHFEGAGDAKQSLIKAVEHVEYTQFSISNNGSDQTAFNEMKRELHSLLSH